MTFDSPKGKISGYLARPKSRGKRPAIVVIHENRGLHPHIQDVARRLAVEGFLAYAPDLLSLVGGTPANEDEALKLHPKMNQDDAVVALVAAVSFLKKHPESTGKVGAVGFCFGGLMVNRLAVASTRARRRRSPITAGSLRTRTWPRSRRRCCCTTRRTTRA